MKHTQLVLFCCLIVCVLDANAIVESIFNAAHRVKCGTYDVINKVSFHRINIEVDNCKDIVNEKKDKLIDEMFVDAKTEQPEILHTTVKQDSSKPLPKLENKNIVDVSPNCPPGHQADGGVCREVM